jgi:hypothetical protein
MKKLTYQEGDIFAVPLRDGGYSVGVVARSPKKGKVLLGYFFRARFPSVPKPSDLPVLLPENAIKVAKFGDLSLMTGEWPVLGHLENWDRDDWPMPKFIRRDPLGKRARLVSYADNDPNQEIAEEPCSFEATGYEADTLWGAGFAEILLTKLLGATPADRNEAGERGQDKADL